MQPVSQQESQRRSFIEEARRKQIVDAAVEALAEVGYAKASMGEIAKRAGISRGLISYHFASKTDLLVQVLTSGYVDGAEFMGPRIDAAVTPRDQLLAYVRSNLEYMRVHPQRMVAVVEIIMGAGPEGLPGINPVETDRLILEPLESLLRAGVEAGEFRELDPTVMARIVRQVIDGVPTLLSGNRELDLDHYIDEVITAIDHATRAHQPRGAGT